MRNFEKLASEESCLPESLIGEEPFVVCAPDVESGISPFTQSAVVTVLSYLLIKQMQCVKKVRLS